MKKYRKKPVIIEAFRITKDMLIDNKFPIKGIVKLGSLHCHPIDRELYDYRYYIETLEGEMEVREGDYVIKGIKGEFYPCKPDIFKATYENIN